MDEYERERFGDLISVPGTVNRFSDESRVRGFLKGHKLSIHFPDIHTVDKMSVMHDKFAAAVSGTTGGTLGGELVLTMDKDRFEQKFGSLRR